MFQAILFHKLDESLLWKHEEDILTSDVFGAFKYLPAAYLNAWIVRLRERHPLLKPAFEMVCGLPDVKFWPQFHAAKESRETCEPDVVLTWGNLAVVIEAKLESHLEVQQLQVERESTKQASMAGGLVAEVIVVAVGRHRPAWWLHQRQSTEHWLAFSSWGTLADVFHATLAERRAIGVEPEEAALVDDILVRLKIRGVEPFGFGSLARRGPPSRPHFVPCEADRSTSVFPIHTSAPQVRLAEYWPPITNLRMSLLDLAKRAPVHEMTQLVIRKSPQCTSGFPGLVEVGRGVPKRFAQVWSLELKGSPTIEYCISAWRIAPDGRLAKVWQPLVRGVRSVGVRRARTKEPT